MTQGDGPLVYVPRRGPNAPRKQKTKKKGWGILLDVIGGVLVAVMTFALFKITYVAPENKGKEETGVESVEPEEPEEPEVEYAKVNLQSVVDSWAGSLASGVETGVMIYDLDREEIVGELNAKERFASESLYKLFVVYKGYELIQDLSLDANRSCYGGKNVRECLDLAIRESNSSAAETLWSIIGRDVVEAAIHDEFMLDNSSASGLYTTAADMVQMMKIYYRHAGLSEAMIAQIKDSMLNQPPSDPLNLCGGRCDWRQGLPSGFSERVKVYNKVGWRYDGAKWASYHDVAILEFGEERHFAIAVMTSGLRSYSEISRFEGMVEEAISSQLGAKGE